MRPLLRPVTRQREATRLPSWFWNVSTTWNSKWRTLAWKSFTQALNASRPTMSRPPEVTTKSSCTRRSMASGFCGCFHTSRQKFSTIATLSCGMAVLRCIKTLPGPDDTLAVKGQPDRAVSSGVVGADAARPLQGGAAKTFNQTARGTISAVAICRGFRGFVASAAHRNVCRLRQRRRAANIGAAGKIRAAARDDLVDELHRVGRQESLRLPGCDRPVADRHAAMHQHRHANAGR